MLTLPDNSSSQDLCTFSPREIQTMIAAAPSPWWQAFLRLMTTSGLRVQEALRLHRSDLDERTLSVRVTSDPTDDMADENMISLRRWIPPSQERAIPVEPAVMDALARLCAEEPDHRHVFVPDWRLDQLWSRIVAGIPLSTTALAPRLPDWFTMVQRRARVTIAKREGARLESIAWNIRPLSALRGTAISRLCAALAPCEAAERLGVRPGRSLQSYLAIASPLA